MFDDLMSASEARIKIAKNTKRLCDGVENAILIAISENKLTTDRYMSDIELSIVYGKLTELGYSVIKLEKSGSDSYRIQINW